MPTVLNAEQARHILGGQAALWSEYLLSSWHVQRAAFPRVDALSEVLWTRSSRMSWAQFLDRMPAQMQRYRRQNIAAADSAFAVDFQLDRVDPVDNSRNAALRTGGGAVSLANQTGFGNIVYTLDGSEPTAASPAYTTPLKLKLGTRIKAASFANDGTLLAQARTYDFSADTLLVRFSNQLEPCSGPSLLLRLPLTPNSPAAAPVFNINLLNSCYIYPDASLDGVEALRIDIARLARNFGLANHKNELKSHPAQTRFGELVVYQDRCEGGTELVRAVLPDPASSDARQTLLAPMARARGEHDLCVIFTGPTDGPLYAIETMKLMR
jgi:hexosaminidase